MEHAVAEYAPPPAPPREFTAAFRFTRKNETRVEHVCETAACVQEALGPAYEVIPLYERGGALFQEGGFRVCPAGRDTDASRCKTFWFAGAASGLWPFLPSEWDDRWALDGWIHGDEARFVWPANTRGSVLLGNVPHVATWAFDEVARLAQGLREARWSIVNVV